MKRRGLAAGGNWIRDRVKTIDVWPQQDALANVLRTEVSNGGGPYNVLVDLARVGVPFPLFGIGALGDDHDGRAILADCASYGIDTALLQTVPGAQTSATDVMTVAGTGRRTFFHQRGANARLDEPFFDFARISAEHLHLAYLLLLDSLDLADPEYGTRAGRVLAKARASGLTTSIDVVSEDSDRFPQVVLPVLPYVDLAFMNEFELSRCTGYRIVPGEDPQNLWEATRYLFERGLRGVAVIHLPNGAYVMDSAGQRWSCPAKNVPPDEIAGAAGAGDAFAAGFLHGWLLREPVEACLERAVGLAALSLRHPSCSLGIPDARVRKPE